MGRGNWFPGSSLSDCEVAYADISDPENEDDCDAALWRYQDFRDCMRECLPKSFVMASDHDRGHFRLDRDSVVVAYNALFVLWSDSQADDHHLGIGFTVREGAPAFAKSRLAQTARLFFDQLNDRYPLSVRSSAWTSVPYESQVKS